MKPRSRYQTRNSRNWPSNATSFTASGTTDCGHASHRPSCEVFKLFLLASLADAREVVVVQLQLLDLMIPKECGAVPMDAATRADLIDLMARVLVAVFHEEGRRDNDRGLVQSQNQTGAPGPQSDCLPPAVQRKTSTTE